MKVLLSILISLTVPVRPVLAATSNKIQFKPDEIQFLFSQFKTVGGALEMLRIISPAEDYKNIKQLLLQDGLVESDRFPEFIYDGTTIAMKGHPQKFDLVNLASGQVSANGNSWFLDRRRNATENFISLRNFMTPKQNAGLFSLILPEAYANTSKLKAFGMGVLAVHLGGFGIILAIGSGNAAVVGAGAATAAGALGAGTAATMVAGGIVLIAASETAFRAAGRYLTGSKVYCLNRKVVIEDSAGKIEEVQWTGTGQVGAGELFLRKHFCEDRSLMDRVTGAFRGLKDLVTGGSASSIR